MASRTAARLGHLGPGGPKRQPLRMRLAANRGIAWKSTPPPLANNRGYGTPWISGLGFHEMTAERFSISAMAGGERKTKRGHIAIFQSMGESAIGGCVWRT